MLLTIERVVLLKRVSLFERTPDRVLAGLARTLVEEEFPAGTDLIVEGAVEDWLFVLIDGSVRVTRSDGRYLGAPPAAPCCAPTTT